MEVFTNESKNKNLTWNKLAWLHWSQTILCLKQLRNWLWLSEWRLVFILPIYLLVYLFIYLYLFRSITLFIGTRMPNSFITWSTFWSKVGEGCSFLCRNTLWEQYCMQDCSAVYLLISSKEADSEEVQFCGSLTINSILNLILFLYFFGLKTLGLRFIM